MSFSVVCAIKSTAIGPQFIHPSFLNARTMKNTATETDPPRSTTAELGKFGCTSHSSYVMTITPPTPPPTPEDKPTIHLEIRGPVIFIPVSFDEPTMRSARTCPTCRSNTLRCVFAHQNPCTRTARRGSHVWSPLMSKVFVRRLYFSIRGEQVSEV